MRLVVVTPTLGLSPYLSAAVESVSRTTLSVEHILVAPPAASDKLRTQYPRCTIVAEAKPDGMYAAIDAGLRAAKPWDWFTYLNDDDLLHDGFGRVAREHMHAGDSMAIAYGNVNWIDARGESLGLMPLEKKPSHIGYVMKLGLGPLTQQGALVGRSLYATLGGFDTQYRLAADFDFWVRAFAAGATFHYYDELVASWRIHAEQASSNRAAAHREAQRISATVPVPASAQRLLWEFLRFRLLNGARYANRRWRTGTWRSEALFVGAAKG